MKHLLIILLLTSPTFASTFDPNTFSSSLEFAQVTNAKVTQQTNGNWCISATVMHNDQGWKHFADGWEVIDKNGVQLGYRELAHPHDNEQPFTRSLCNIEIPLDLSEVFVRAKCNQHGFGGQIFTVNLTNTRK